MGMKEKTVRLQRDEKEEDRRKDTDNEGKVSSRGRYMNERAIDGTA